MKKFFGVVRTILIGIWVIVALFITICLLSYNDYNITVINKHSFLVIDNDEMEPDYYDGDLVIVKRNSDSKINIGDKVFFYNGNRANEYLINVGEVTDKQKITNTETTFDINGKPVSGEYVVGRAENAKVFSHLGTVLSILTSRWGFMFIVILPTLFGLVYEVIVIIDEVKKTKKGVTTE